MLSPWEKEKRPSQYCKMHPAYVECRVRRIMDDLGDHVIVILEVLEAECRQQTQPMTIAESPWQYGG